MDELRIILFYGGDAATEPREELLNWLRTPRVKTILGRPIDARKVSDWPAHSEGSIDTRVSDAIAWADVAIALITPDPRGTHGAPNVLEEIGRWRGRTQFQHQVPRLWQAVHTHRIVTGGLVVYSSVVGIILVMGVTPPLLVFLLALPVLAGGAGGWWELRQDARHATQRILHQGMLTGLLATTLPVLLMVVGEVWLAWQTGWYSADPTRMAVEHPVGWGARWGHLLRWVGSFLGVGIILGVVGALIGQGIAALLGRFQHRGSG